MTVRTVAIIGAGPAGYTAGIYVGRAGMDALIFDKGGGGGLAVNAPTVENYPGFPSISGMDLAEEFRKHAEQYAKMHLFEGIDTVKKADGGGFLVVSDKKEYPVDSIIFATGSVHRRLGVKGEDTLFGSGVSYCATCDGFLFREKRVVVVGGGNTAFSEALFLKNVGCSEVSIIHRREGFRADEIYVQQAKKTGIRLLLNRTVEEISGDGVVSEVKVKNKISGEEETVSCDGVFIAVGVEPENALAKALDVKCEDNGFITVDRTMRTNIEGIFAAGDVTGGIRQVVTACAEGAVAASSIATDI